MIKKYMEKSIESDELAYEFERAAEERDCIQDAIYWGRMVKQCEEFLNEFDDHEFEADEYKEFMESDKTDPDLLRDLHEYDIEMLNEDVSSELSDSTFVYVEKAKDINELKKFLINDWNPCTKNIEDLTIENKKKCREIMNKIAEKVQKKFPDVFDDF